VESGTSGLSVCIQSKQSLGFWVNKVNAPNICEMNISAVRRFTDFDIIFLTTVKIDANFWQLYVSINQKSLLE